MKLPEIIPWKQTAVVAAAAVMALASLTVSVRTSLQLEQRINAAQDVRDLRRQIMMAGTALREAEAAQRMYIITGEDAHLLPLTAVRLSIGDRWRAVAAAVEKVPGVSPDVAELEASARTSLDSLNATAEVRRAGGRGAGMDRVIAGESYEKLAALHARLEALMDQLEERSMAETRAVTLAVSRGRTVALAAGLVALGLGGLGIWQWRQALRHYRRELELKAEASRAEQTARDKRSFLAVMSHEVRTPLNAILGMSEQLHASLTDPAAARQAGTVVAAGRDMLRLVNDLLDLSRLEAGGLELEPAPMPVARQVEWARDLFGPMAREKGVRLEVSAAEDMPAAVRMDEGRFRQVVVNLTGNALKFTPAGGFVRVRLERTDNASGGELVLEVKDSGCGIPADMKAAVFRPYVQAAQGGRFPAQEPGSGLGLAIVRELVLLMKGAISLQSRPGEGAVFRITLPLEPAAEAEAEGPAPGRGAFPSGVAGGSLRAGADADAEARVPAGEPGRLSSARQPELSPRQSARLMEILRVRHTRAAATQSTADVADLAAALDELGAEAGAPWLRQAARELADASSAFSLGALAAALRDLPARVAQGTGAAISAAPASRTASVAVLTK